MLPQGPVRLHVAINTKLSHGTLDGLVSNLDMYLLRSALLGCYCEAPLL